MQYSPKLKRAAEQIKKILKDNDLAGFAVIHTPGNSEFILEITPSYSAAKWNATRDRVIIEGKAAHYNGDKAKRDKKLTDTMNMFHHLSTVTGTNSLSLMQISELADKAWNAEHNGSGFTSEQEQNN